jgi:hypothetical protein
MSSWSSRPGPSWTGTTRASWPSCTRCSSGGLGQNRTSSDVATVARLVTQGAVDTLFVDIDGVVLGEVDEEGAVRFGDEQVPGGIGVVDEIARRGWLSGARLLAVRRGDVPGGGDLAAILRYAT